MKLKLVITSALITGLLLTSTGFAASGIKVNGKKFFTAAAGVGQINCYYHNTDVCIANDSNQTVYFNVPLLNQSGPLSPPDWVDVYSNYNYPSLGVTIVNSYDQPIFNQPVLNHSVIYINNGTKLSSGKTRLKITVK